MITLPKNGRKDRSALIYQNRIWSLKRFIWWMIGVWNTIYFRRWSSDRRRKAFRHSILSSIRHYRSALYPDFRWFLYFGKIKGLYIPCWDPIVRRRKKSDVQRYQFVPLGWPVVQLWFLSNVVSETSRQDRPYCRLPSAYLSDGHIIISQHCKGALRVNKATVFKPWFCSFLCKTLLLPFSIPISKGVFYRRIGLLPGC